MPTNQELVDFFISSRLDLEQIIVPTNLIHVLRASKFEKYLLLYPKVFALEKGLFVPKGTISHRRYHIYLSKENHPDIERVRYEDQPMFGKTNLAPYIHNSSYYSIQDSFKRWLNQHLPEHHLILTL